MLKTQQQETLDKLTAEFEELNKKESTPMKFGLASIVAETAERIKNKASYAVSNQALLQLRDEMITADIEELRPTMQALGLELKREHAWLWIGKDSRISYRDISKLDDYGDCYIACIRRSIYSSTNSTICCECDSLEQAITRLERSIKKEYQKDKL